MVQNIQLRKLARHLQATGNYERLCTVLRRLSIVEREQAGMWLVRLADAVSHIDTTEERDVLREALEWFISVGDKRKASAIASRLATFNRF